MQVVQRVAPDVLLCELFQGSCGTGLLLAAHHGTAIPIECRRVPDTTLRLSNSAMGGQEVPAVGVQEMLALTTHADVSNVASVTVEAVDHSKVCSNVMCCQSKHLLPVCSAGQREALN